jgi:uncharacterized damage-inducible protein DinB
MSSGVSVTGSLTPVTLSIMLPEPWLIPFRFNEWATRSMLQRCRLLNDEQFNRPFDLGPGSLHDTFLHIIGAMARWSDRIAESTLRPSTEDDPRRRSIEELIAMLAEAARDLEAAARQVHERDHHDQLLHWPRGEGLAPYRFRKAAALVHVTTHGMHHRAQARWMMRQLGIELKEDFDAVEFELAETGQL